MSIDRLQAAIQAKSFVCVGLDPRLEWLPTEGTVSAVSYTHLTLPTTR